MYCFSHVTPARDISTLSLHDALPIWPRRESVDFSITFFVTGAQFLVKKGSPIKGIESIAGRRVAAQQGSTNAKIIRERVDRKSTRLNSSHITISYAVFCLKKKKKNERNKNIKKNKKKKKNTIK